MSDPRLTPDPARITRSTPACVSVAVADLNRTANGRRDRQLLYGDDVVILGEQDGYCYVQSTKDDYCGYVAAEQLGSPQSPTHVISAPATHAYSDADLKSPDMSALSFGSRIAVQGFARNFARTAIGYIPAQHISPLDAHASDPATIAALFLGTPYLWGGNSRWGIDCSGLVQASLLACGIPCPGDSDLQISLGEAAQPPYRRNDLLFWKGHVAIISEAKTLIHANAHAMATRYEPVSETISRIEKAGDGPVIAHRRLARFSG